MPGSNKSMIPSLEADAVVFDAYGTLFDVASSARRHAGRLGDHWPAFADLWRRKQLEYTWLRSVAGRHTDFWQITSESLDYALAAHRVDDPALRAALLQQYLNLDAYPDVKPALARLRAAGKKTATLSNGTPAMLAAALESAGIGALLESALSVEMAGVFKPHPSVYQLAVDRLGVPANRICFVSANGWDAWAGSAFGFHSVWINRSDAPAERLPGAPAAVVRGVGEVPALLGL
jgi:2-haloacid dehalogenase